MRVSAEHHRRGRPGQRLVEMTASAREAWLDSYDRWVEKWNVHERDLDLPLSPAWPDAPVLFGGERLSEFCFIPRCWDLGAGGTGYGILRMNQRGWVPFEKGWSFCRRPAIRPPAGAWWLLPPGWNGGEPMPEMAEMAPA